MKINYLSQDSPDDYIIKQSEFKDSSGMPYKRCPCFNHKNERTFIISSPIDYEFRVDEPIDANFLHYNQEHLDTLVFHMTTPHFLLWTSDDNVWLEANDHPMTALDNNMVMIPGWVQLSTWPSKASIGFQVVDKTKPKKFNGKYNCNKKVLTTTKSPTDIFPFAISSPAIPITKKSPNAIIPP